MVAYAGVPLRAGGEAVGTLCAIDFKPRTWSEDDLGVLADLAGGATAELQLLAATRTVARHSASLQALTRLSNGLATAQTADDVLRELLPALERFHASAVRVLLTDESGHALRTAAATDGGSPPRSARLPAAARPRATRDRRARPCLLTSARSTRIGLRRAVRRWRSSRGAEPLTSRAASGHRWARMPRTGTRQGRGSRDGSRRRSGR